MTKLNEATKILDINEKITKPVLSFNSKKIRFLRMPHLTHVPI
jgi:hypothetical protein